MNADDFAAALAADDAAESAPPPAAVTDPNQVDAMALITAQGCLACHAIGGEGGMVAPPFEELRGQDPAVVREGIVDPMATINEEYSAFAGTMPTIFEDLMSPVELDVLVNFLVGDAGSGAGPDADVPGESPDAAADSTDGTGGGR